MTILIVASIIVVIVVVTLAFWGDDEEEVITGGPWAQARRETLEVRLEDQRLRTAWLQAESEEDKDRIQQLIDANLSKLIDIENRYFGT